MATLVISMTSGLGNTSVTKTFSAADAQRIISGFQKVSGNPSATQTDLNNALMVDALRFVQGGIAINETVTTAPLSVTFT